MWSLLVMLPFLLTASAEDILVTVKSPSWEIVGKRRTVLGKELDEFRGIPYAVPPVNEKRFKKPEHLSNFPEKVEALEIPPSCLQIPLLIEEYLKSLPFKVAEEEKEDCLYLNIWRPSPIDGKEEEPKAVMVWIYGGAFLIGSSNLPFYDGSILSTLGDVVVVNMNYRLGSFGFFSAGTEEEPGNLGLYDQAMALRWVQENIHYFGGDPSRVTIFGTSAGGISVSAHITSPVSKGLFQRAIVESGTTTMPKLVDSKETVIGLSSKIAEKLKCEDESVTLSNNPEEVLKCIRAKDAAEVISAEKEVYKEGKGYTQLAAIYDEDFLKYKSKAPFRPSTINDVDVIIGVTKDEGASLFFLFFPELFDPKRPKLTNEEILIKTKSLFSTPKTQPEIDAAYASYMEGVPMDNATAANMALSRVLTHHLFSCPSFFYINNQGFKKRKVHFYYYTHHLSFTDYTMHLEKWPGAFHSNEVFFIFGLPIMLKNSVFTEKENQFSEEMIELWTSFAKSGTPQSSRHYHWPLYKRSNPQVLELNADRASVLKFPPADRCWSLWKDILNPPTPEEICYKKNDGTEECEGQDDE